MRQGPFALLSIEAILVIRAQQGVGVPKRIGELTVVTPLVRNPDEPVGHAVAHPDLNLNAPDRLSTATRSPSTTPGLGRGRGLTRNTVSGLRSLSQGMWRT
ncbi:hypothetical protein GGD64_005411 [Bradyrhizobium sp. CIR3A]|nr:hypothetical protein [Bradyrhizobium sp. CIR3A]